MPPPPWRDRRRLLRRWVDDEVGVADLSLSEAKTRVVHIDEGFTFLGFRIRRDRKKGTNKRYVYTYPSKEALASIKRKVRTITNQGTNQPLENLLRQLNAALRGWTNYFRHGVSKQTFSYLSHFTWWRVVKWLRRKHRRTGWKKLRRRYLPGTGRTWPTDGETVLFDPAAVTVTRYRYRGNIPTPWQQDPETRGEPDARTTCTSGSEVQSGKPTDRNIGTAPRSDPYQSVSKRMRFRCSDELLASPVPAWKAGALPLSYTRRH